MGKEYRGLRFPDGSVVVEVLDGEKTADLDVRLDIRVHSPTGFEWGFPGSGPAQLALAILADFTGFVPSPRLYQAFKGKYIQTIKDDRWLITEEQITRFLMEQDPAGDLDVLIQD